MFGLTILKPTCRFFNIIIDVNLYIMYNMMMLLMMVVAFPDVPHCSPTI